uniref:Uncharacterized protein LOC108040549 n=1 Tax=Drosophila rhopaloa TaxID=1041015 RepID=A0A6P4E682_DRORH
MDLSKAESQTPADRRSGSPDYLRTLLQDLLCFFALLSVALLIVAGILFVVEDVSRMQQQHQHLHHRHLHRDKNANNSGRSLAEEPPNQGRPYFRPHTWIRFFSCQGKQPQQQPEEAEKEEPKQFDQKQQPTYISSRGTSTIPGWRRPYRGRSCQQTAGLGAPSTSGR